MKILKTSMVLLGVLVLAGCEKDRTDRTGSTTITGATSDASVMAPEPRLGQPSMPSTDTTPRQAQPNAGDMPAQPSTSSTTKNTAAVRAKLAKDRVAPTAVITDIMIADDGEMIILSGTVPDAKTHEAVLKSAQKTPGVKGVKDDLKISGH